MNLDWLSFKNLVIKKNISIQWVDIDNTYWLKAFDGNFEISCILIKDSGQEQIDFETNFKASGNSPLNAPSPFASKTFGSKNLFKRVVGIRQSVSIGDNTILYTETFPWVKFMALEVVGGETGDYCSLYVLDTSTGTYSGYPNSQLNQFGFTANIGKDFYQHKSEFDADVYQGLQIKIIYNSISNKNIGINFVMNEVK